MSQIKLSHEQVYTAWSEFTYPRAAVTEPTEAFMRAVRYIDDALPGAFATELERLAAAIRADVQRLPEYQHGCLAWRVLNEIDGRVADLRAGAAVSRPGGGP